jgi:DNA invertase Pin-like site-specific DNA recombinase
MPTSKLRAAIYCRISSDDTGEALGVQRQLEDCEKLCADRGWPIVCTYVDNDVSAFSGKPRARYRALIDAIEGGDVDVVICWHPDRLHRSPRELEDFIDLLEATGCTVQTCTAGVWDLSTPDSRAMARIGGAIARKESEDKSRRLKRKHLELARDGKPTGRGASKKRPPFGYRPGGLKVNEHEAELLREAARNIISGAESLHGLARRWNDGGVRVPFADRWTAQSLRKLLSGPRPAGLRRHNGIEYPAAWPAVLTTNAHEALVAVFADPSRAAVPRRRGPLTGLCQCGACGTRMGRNRDRVRCLADAGGCGRVSMKHDLVVAAVLDAVVEHLDEMDPQPEHDEQAEELTTELRRLEARRLDLAERFAVAGEADEAEILAARKAITGRIDEVRADLATIPAGATPWRTEEAFRGAWESMTDADRWAALRSLVDHVEVAPYAGRRGDADRVVVVWRLLRRRRGFGGSVRRG